MERNSGKDRQKAPHEIAKILGLTKKRSSGARRLRRRPSGWIPFGVVEGRFVEARWITRERGGPAKLVIRPREAK